MNETIYYKSPVGILRLRNDGNALAEVHFMHSERGGKVDESTLVPVDPAAPVLKQTAAQLDDYFAGRLFQFNLPLQQQGTEFQQRVWAALLAIPFGSTCSYLVLSKNLGDIKAIRAVGTANGKNNIAIIVPCHRVIGKDGKLVGYGGDLWRKKWLLDHEAKHAHGVQYLF